MNSHLAASPSFTSSAAAEILESRIAPATLFAVDATKNLLMFDSDTPGTIDDTTPLTNFATNTEDVRGIDFRPSTGALYLLTQDAGNVGRLYTVNLDSGVVSLASTLSTALSGTSFGVDFNPVVDRLRIVSDADQNLRVNVDTGTTTVDAPINPGAPNVVGSAYTNNSRTASATQLYGIDSVTDQLVLQSPPNDGTVTAVGPLGVDAGAAVGFDLTSDNQAFATLAVGLNTNLYSINLSTGAATLAGGVGNGLVGITGLAAALPGISGSSMTYRDIDGDIVTVKTSKGDLTDATFVFAGGGTAGGAQLQSLTLGPNTAFSDTSLSITAVRGPAGGDGYANVGYINATNFDLGRVTVDGDLGQIDAGDATPTDVGLLSLTALSMGNLGLSTQAAGGSLNSSIAGSVGTLTLKTHLDGAQFSISGSIGTIRIGGDLVGGGTVGSGSVLVEGNIGTVTIGGTLLGGTADLAGSIVGNNITSVSVLGSLQGGTQQDTGSIVSNGALGTVKIRGGLLGGSGAESGTIDGTTSIRSVSIGQNVIGGGGQYSGSIYTGGGGDLGRIGNVTIGGDLRATTNALTGIISDATLGAVKIGGDVRGVNGVTAKIIAEGLLTPTTQRAALAIQSVTVTGTVEFGDIFAGYSVLGAASNADVAIGAINVRGDFIASNVVAGATSGGDGFGNANDALFMGGENSAIVASIASITIGGSAFGTPGGADAYGFVAEQIVRFRVGATNFPLLAGRGNDNPAVGTPPPNANTYAVGPTGDLRILELVDPA